MIIILSSTIAVLVLAGLFGIGLAAASAKLAVKKDQRVEDLENILPGINCGACGYAGCSSYAKAMAEDEEEAVDLGLCSPGGPETLKKLGEYLGRAVDETAEKKVAFVFCRGNRTNAQYDFEYDGIDDCNAAYIAFNGDKTCKFGCLGRGSCIKVCPADAIYRDSTGNILIDKYKCISCEKCVTICPTGVIKMIPESADVVVACSSTDKGALVRKYCKVGCIGCRICEKQSPEGGFIIEDFLASIDYSSKGSRKAAMEKCPSKCIVDSNVKQLSLENKITESETDEES